MGADRPDDDLAAVIGQGRRELRKGPSGGGVRFGERKSRRLIHSRSCATSRLVNLLGEDRDSVIAALEQLTEEDQSRVIAQFRSVRGVWYLEPFTANLLGLLLAVAVFFGIWAVTISFYNYDFEGQRREQKLMECLEGASGSLPDTFCHVYWGK